MNVYKLEAAIGLNSTEYQKGLKAAGESMSSMGDKIKAGAAAMAKVSVAAFTAITGAATATTAAIIKGVDAYTTYGDNVDKMSQKLNMSAQAYQEWSAIMEHSGTSVDSLQASMKTLANAVETGNDAFERLGISQEEIASMNNEQLFSRTITALQNVGNETERTYLAGQLLGRGATELGALLNTSAEDTEKMRQQVHELGGVMSDEAVKASAKYKDSIQDMKTAFKGLGRGLIADVVPAMTEISDGLTAIFTGDENGTDLFMQGFDKALASFGNSASKLKPIIQKVGEIAVKTIPQIISSVGKALIKTAPELLSATSSMMKELWSNFANSDLGVFDWIKEDAVKVVESVKGIFKNINFEAIKESFHKVGTAFNNAFSMIGDGIAWVSENVIAPLVEWGANEVLPKVFDSLAASVEILTSAFEFLKEPAEKVWNSFLKPLAEGAGIVISGGLDLIADSLTSIANELEDVEWSGFWDDISNGEFFADWKRGADGIAEWFDTHGKDIDEFFGSSGFGSKWNEFWQKVGAEAQETQEMWKDCFTIIGHYLGEFVRAWKTGAKEITDAIDSIKKKYKEFKELWGAGADTIKESSQKTVGGLAFSYLKSKLPGFAEGGRVTQPTIAMIGEREPETVIPDSKLGAIGNTYNVTVNIDGTGKNAEEIADEAIEVISTKLDILGIQQQRAVGGKSWA